MPRKQKQIRDMKNQNLVKKENGKIRIKPAPEGFEVDTENSIIVYKQIESKYPLKVEEIGNRDWYIDEFGSIEVGSGCCDDLNQLSSEKRAKAFLALMQLVELRDAWNEIDIKNKSNYAYSISCSSDYCVIKTDYTSSSEYAPSVLTFYKEETRNKFMTTFKDLINTAKELL